MSTNTTQPRPKQRRGFAGMSLEKRTAIARKGGAAVSPENRAFSKDRDLATQAGRKGGEANKVRVLGR